MEPGFAAVAALVLAAAERVLGRVTPEEERPVGFTPAVRTTDFPVPAEGGLVGMAEGFDWLG